MDTRIRAVEADSMIRGQPNEPKYRRQKSRTRGDRAFVKLNGVRHYLGAYGSPESQEAYHRLLTEWTASHAQPPAGPEPLAIVELVSRFWAHVKHHYQHADGTPTSEVANHQQALRLLKALYADTKAADFGPLKLKAVRQAMVDKGWCRDTVNKAVGRLRNAFRWATENELIPPSVYHGLQAVAGLKRGRTDARESGGVKAVPDEIVDATLAHLTPTLAAMVQLERLTGMRPGEVCALRTCDLNMAAGVWTYTPESHKTEHHGRRRTVFVGPKAQEVLRPCLSHDLEAYVFSPARSTSERRAAKHEARKTPLNRGNMPGSNRKRSPDRAPGDRYVTASYRAAIAYACKQAWPAPDGLDAEERKLWHVEHLWTPNQLRHGFGTTVRREHGLEAAQVLLGHARADVTQIYAERDVAKAIGIAMSVG